MWQRPDHIASLHYQLTLVNGDPSAADHNPFEYQFSFDKQVRETDESDFELPISILKLVYISCVDVIVTGRLIMM